MSTPMPTPASATGPGPRGRLTSYEHQRLAEIRRWYGREPGTADRLLAGASDRARALLARVLDSERGRRAIERGTDRVLEELDQRLLRDVDEAAPLAGVSDPTDERRAQALRRADGRAGELHTRYVGWLGGQAAIAGAASVTLPLAVVAMAADIAGAVVGSLRATGHTLVVYGVDRDDPCLLPASVALVAAASETDVAVRRSTVDDAIARIAGDDVSCTPEERLPRIVAQQTGSRTIREAVEQTLRRTLRRRAVSLVPVLGAAASGAASAWLASRVTESAANAGVVTFLYRHAGLDVDALPAGS